MDTLAPAPPPEGSRVAGGAARSTARGVLLGAACLAAAACVAASAVSVSVGQAIVVTQFGQTVRVLTQPGLAWKLPWPVQGSLPIDLRLHTTSSAPEGAATRDGTPILAQAFVLWRVAPAPDAVQKFAAAVHGDTRIAADQLAGLIGAALPPAAASFDFADFINADPKHARLDAFEALLQSRLVPTLRDTYGITVDRVGLERLNLPASVVAATAARLKAAREAQAAARAADTLREAAEIRAEASRDSRIMAAQAQTQAAEIEAASRREAAEIQAKAYTADPELYVMLRSLDTLSAVVGPGTRLVLRTDAAPFNVLVQGPPGDVPK